MAAPAACAWAMADDNARSASVSPPCSHSARARYPRVMDSSIHSPSPSSASVRRPNLIAPSASPQSWARAARPSAIAAGTFASWLAPRPADGSNGSSATPGSIASARSAASSSGSIASTLPPEIASNACVRHSRGRELISPAGSSASHRSTVAPSPSKKRPSTFRSISRAAQTGSPAASACRTASSANPCSSDQAAALRCSAGIRLGCSCRSLARRRSANSGWYRHQQRTSSSGIRNSPACSTCCSIAWLSVRPMTASHSPPLRRSSNEVSSRNLRRSSAWPSSTSSVR